MKYFIVFTSAVLISFLCVSCSKNEYKPLSGDITLTGYAYMTDSFSNLPPIPLRNQKIYLNTGSDTSSYIFQTNTDSLGMFSINSLTKNYSYTLFCRFITDNIEYKGAVQWTAQNANNERVILNIYPIHMNGMSVLFTDTAGGYMPNLPFRIYTSKVLASLDSVAYAFVNTNSSITGQYLNYNVSPAEYYIVSKLILGTDTLKVFDSLKVESNVVKRDTMIVR